MKRLNLYAYCANNPVYYVDPSGNVKSICQSGYEKLVQKFILGKASTKDTYAMKKYEKFNRPKVYKTNNKYWNKKINFRGNDVYQRDDLFDPNKMVKRKIKNKIICETNVERMRAGLAPIGLDGKSVELHHLSQTQYGGIAEVTSSFHKKYYKILHINTGQLPSSIDRDLFEKWKRYYWISRSYDF